MDDETPQPTAIAASEDPVQLSVALVEDERVPEGMVCMGTFRDGKLVARSVVPPEAWEQIVELKIFDEPVQVVLVARAAPPGLQCQLYAMVELENAEEEDSEEPWSSSVPRPDFEESPGAADGGEEGPAVAPIPLGHIVRFDRDRVHPESLPLEAANVLRKIIDGDTSEVVDRALSDLLGL